MILIEIFFLYSWLLVGVAIYIIGRTKKEKKLKNFLFVIIVTSILSAIIHKNGPMRYESRYMISIITAILATLGYIACDMDKKE